MFMAKFVSFNDTIIIWYSYEIYENFCRPVYFDGVCPEFLF